MKKAFKHYLAFWAVLLVLFNVIAFGSVGWTFSDKYTPSFWMGYVFITIAFVGQLICAHVALKETNIKKTFYKLSLITTSYTGLVLSFVFGGLCMFFSWLPYWVGIIPCAIVLAANIIAVIKASAAVEIVSAVDEKVKAKTQFIKSLRVDVELLANNEADSAVKAELQKLAEKVRFSDPMSCPELSAIENEIADKTNALKTAADKLAVIAEIDALLTERNAKTKILK